MVTVADKLELVRTTKSNIKTAIEAKGVTVGAVPFADYPAKIALIEGGGGGPTPPTPEPWVRNASWPALSCASGDNKATGLYAVWPHGSNFIRVTATTTGTGYTVDWGDGTTANFASNAGAEYAFDYSSSALAGTDAPVTFIAATSTVNRTAHGYTNGQTVQFYNIVTTTGLIEDISYYVINATTDTFQVSTTAGGSAITLTGDGSATLLPYKIATVTITPQSGATITSLNFLNKHTSAQNGGSSGWLEIKIAIATLTGISLGNSGTASNYLHRLLENVELIQNGNITSFSYLFGYCYSLKSVTLNQTSSVTSMSYMFYNCNSLQTVSLFDTSAVTSMFSMFYNCYSLQTVPQFNTANVTNMSSMFGLCYSFHTCPEFNTIKVTNMGSMFTGARLLQTVPQFNTAAVTNMNYMFNGCNSLKTVPQFNTANVTDMNGMFNSCNSLVEVPLFNTIKVTNMGDMFRECRALPTVPQFNTAAVTNMSSMFRLCQSLKSVPLFNTANVTNMGNMFTECYVLEFVPQFDTSKVTNMYEMLGNCRSLKSVGFVNTGNVTTMQDMFVNCISLKSVPDFDTIKVNNMGGMFNGCENLETVPDLYMNAPTSSSGYSSMFNNCRSLSKIQAKEFRWTFSVSNCNLGPTELNEIYTNLPTVTGQTITVSGNWGTATDDPTIATAKGWTVTG